MMRSFVVALALLLPIALPAAGAQLPRFTLDLTGGGGDHSMQAGEVYYRQPFDTHVRATASLRLLRSDRFSPVLVLERISAGGSGMHADCPLAPNGSCVRYFPDAEGTGVGAGLRFAPVRRISLGAGYTRISGERTWNALDAEVAVTLWRHFGLVGTARHLSSRNPDGNRIWFRPLGFGIRVQ